MTRYPLLFTYTDVVDGEGFQAQVVAAGRATLTDEGDSCWIDGVNPGAIAEGGTRPADALARFRVSYHSVLEQFAAEATDFPAFKTRVERFFHDTDDATLSEWNAAVAEVRQGTVDAPLPRVNADQAFIGVAVSLKDNAPNADRGFSEITPAIAA